MTGVSTSFMPVVTSSGTLEEAFPDVDPNYEPLGSMVLIQVRAAKRTTGRQIDTNDGRKVEIELPPEVRATIQANTQVGKVLGYGSLAFCNRNTGQRWPEGAWVQPGDFVRVPRFGGDRWEIQHGDGVILFIALRDLDLGGKVPRPLDAVAYV